MYLLIGYVDKIISNFKLNLVLSKVCDVLRDM